MAQEYFILSLSASTNGGITDTESTYVSTTAATLSFSSVTIDIIDATTISGGTIYSGGTNLYDIFLTTADGNDITRVQPGTNITTGGTNNLPTINLVASPSVNNITFSGTAIGGTVQAAAGTFTSLSAATLSGGTILSGSTNLYSIFSTTDTNDITRVQPGTNITTGGTDNLPVVSLAASPSINNLSFSGTATGGALSATTISATTYYGDGSNLTGISSSSPYTTGFTYNNSNAFTIADNTGGTLSATFNIVTGLTVNGNMVVTGTSDYQGNFISSIIPNTNRALSLGDGTHIWQSVWSQYFRVADNSGNDVILISAPTLASSPDPAWELILPQQTGSTYSLLGVYSVGTNVSNTAWFNLSAGTNIVLNQSGSITGGTLAISAQDTFVTGFTYDNANAFTIRNNNAGGTLSAVINTVTGLTVSGGLSATTISGGTIYSGGTNLYDIFLTTADGNDITRVQPGTNITTGGTDNLPTINLVASPSVNNITFSGTAIGGAGQFAAVTATSLSAATLSGGTILSGSTNLYSIFAPFGTESGVSSVGQGSNITTGGTASNPIINVVASPSFNNVTFSGTAIGGTVQAGAGTFTSLSATTLSGGTILSGSTNLYSIFSTTDTNDITRVQPGTNITTGGTDNLPVVSLVASPSFNNVTFSGTAIGGTVQAGAGTFTSLSATTLSGGTILSGSTNLYDIFLTPFSVSAKTGTQQTFSNGNVLAFAAGSGLTSNISASKIITYDLQFTGTTAEPSPANGDKLLIWDASTNEHKNIDWNQLPGSGGGEVNTASNVGSGFGLFKQKTGFDLEFRSISAGTNISFVTGDTLTINSTASGGSSRITGTTATTNTTLTTVDTIDNLKDNSTNIVTVFIKAYQASAANWGVWKRTLTVTEVSGAVIIREENADVDKQSAGLRANSVTFSVNGGNIDIQVTGIAATTINWESSYEIIL